MAAKPGHMTADVNYRDDERRGLDVTAVIAELEPWPAGERRGFVCPECGCVNYATPVVELDGTTACMYVRFDGPSSARADGLHVSVRGKQVPLDEYVGMEPNEAARVVVDRIEELGHAAEQEA